MAKIYDLQLGAYNKLPTYSVIGTPTSFYVWVNERGQVWASDQGSSNRINGREAFGYYYKLKDLLEFGDQEGFIKLIKQIHKDHQRTK
jgi:hypothetical protein